MDLACRQCMWHRGAVYYQTPLSFQDSNDDGKGDLPGLLSRLDYLSWLGVDAVWLGPIYRSNDTSDEHRWFRESRASRDNPKRDWYVWHDPDRDGGPPNNWLSRFPRGTIVPSTRLDRDGERTGATLELRGDEGAIVALGP